MSDQEEGKPKFKVLEFDNVKSISEERDKDELERNKVLSDMFKKMSERAAKGELDGFVMTLKTSKGSVESLIGGLSRGFDFIGYVGMLESLKMRLLDIMSQFSYMYYASPEKDDKNEPEKED
jgi:hypothetical protein